MLTEWKAQNLSKPEIVVKLAYACLGWPYVFGGLGETCTPVHRRSRINNSHPTIVSKCQVLNGKKSTCDGCQWYPDKKCVLFFDCRGFTRFCLEKGAGILIEGGGASTQYRTDSNWAVKGPISEMPLDKVCVVFRYDSSTGKYEHTLLYDGNGNYVHCSNGVEKTSMAKYKATHYAIPKGLYDQNGSGTVGKPVENIVKPAAGTAIVTGKKVALRIGPSTDAAVLARVDTGSSVKVTNPPDDWVHVTYNGKDGYMMKQFLNVG